MTPNDDQRSFWSEQAGDIWVAEARTMDAKLAPVLEAVLSAADLRRGLKVADVGCGAGTNSFQAAEQVGPDGQVHGVDISAPLLAAARQDQRNSKNTQFTLADAQVHDFGPEQFDVLMSRFGVMFFEDTLAAFRNMARWLKPGARMAFATWGSIAENPFFTLPASVSKEHFGPRPKTDPDAPGPFALRDTQKTCAMLRNAGLSDVAVDVQAMDLTPAGSAADLAALMCRIGPAHKALQDSASPEQDRAALVEKLTAAIAPWQTPQGLRIPAEINIFTAQKAS